MPAPAQNASMRKHSQDSSNEEVGRTATGALYEAEAFLRQSRMMLFEPHSATPLRQRERESARAQARDRESGLRQYPPTAAGGGAGFGMGNTRAFFDVTFEAGGAENGGAGGLKGSESINSERLNRFELIQGEARERCCNYGFVRAMRCCCRLMCTLYP